MQECLNFFYRDLSNNGYVSTDLKSGDGLRLDFQHPPGNDLILQACSLPVRVGRQVPPVGNSNASFSAIAWRLDHGIFRWGRRGEDGGSEHWVEGRRHALELQLLHYNVNKFSNFSSAIESGAADAVLVVAQVVCVCVCVCVCV